MTDPSSTSSSRRCDSFFVGGGNRNEILIESKIQLLKENDNFSNEYNFLKKLYICPDEHSENETEVVIPKKKINYLSNESLFDYFEKLINSENSLTSKNININNELSNLYSIYIRIASSVF